MKMGFKELGIRFPPKVTKVSFSAPAINQMQKNRCNTLFFLICYCWILKIAG